MGNKAVFLDRDGTMAKDIPYCDRVEDFELLPSTPEAVKLLNDNGFKVVVITNQSGVARGYFTEETLGEMHEKMRDEMAKAGARVDGIYYCPHHPDDGCECRKPRLALFERAMRDLDIDLSLSFVVGDMPMDIEAGRRLGCRTVLVSGRDECKPDHMAKDLLDASRWILSPDVAVASVHVLCPCGGRHRVFRGMEAPMYWCGGELKQLKEGDDLEYEES